MKISIVAFDQFTDIDVFLMWDLLKRVRLPDWDVRILGEASHHTSNTGIKIATHDHISWANGADVVLFSSGPGTRSKIKDDKFLSTFQLNPQNQIIGSMCSGALILAALGLLNGVQATTYPTAKTLLESYRVEVVERAFVVNGNVATAAGCLAAQYLVGWVIERLVGQEMRQIVLASVQPVGEGLTFDNIPLEKLYSNAAAKQPTQNYAN